MIKDNRIIFDDNGTKTDYSATLADIETGTVTLPVVALEDKLYLGSTFPFNHRYFSVSTANTSASVISIEIYTSSGWVSAVDVIDKTSLASKTLAQSGIIQFAKPRNSSWTRVDTTENLTELSGFKIYDKYWSRFTFSANLLASTAIKYVGHAFSTDGQLAILYPDLNSSTIKAAFSAGKTNWEDQAVMAADQIIEDLQNREYVYSGNQIMNFEKFQIASVHATALIIYRAFGDDYKDQFEQATKDYNSSLEKAIADIDKNGDGALQVGEQFKELGVFRR